jgi:hypothetical protein
MSKKCNCALSPAESLGIMPKKIAIGVLLLLIVIVAFHISRSRVEVIGSLISIDSGAHHIEGKLEPESTYQFLLKDQGVSINTLSGDAFVTVLPLKTADQLKAQYGDFFRCNAPGAVQAIQSMRGIVLVTDSSKAKETVSEALSLVKASRIPVVSFTGSRIQVLKQTSMKMNVVDNTGTMLYYVRNLEILSPDYLR